MPHDADLDTIGLKYCTDKASFHHDYLRFYEQFFAPVRYEKLNILEVGVLDGASLATWEQYFPNASIVGADIAAGTKRFERGRVSIEILDQGNIEEVTQAAIRRGPFDIVIEDGSHLWEHQITSLRTLFPFVRDGGIYIVEDLQTNYGGMQAHYRGVSSITCMEYLKKLIDIRVGDTEIDLTTIEDAFLRTYGRSMQFMTFYRRACLIKKTVVSSHRAVGPGTSLVGRDPAADWQNVAIVAHVSEHGDIHGGDGWINLGSAMAVQGLSMTSKDAALQYRVRFADRSWSDWCEEGAFRGTRGESELLQGFAVRLREGLPHSYRLRVLGAFVDHDTIVEALAGQDCTSPSAGALIGLQIDLARV